MKRMKMKMRKKHIDKLQGNEGYEGDAKVVG